MCRRICTPTGRCCTRREIGPFVVADKAIRCALEAADRNKEEGIMVMSTTISNPQEVGGVEAATRTDKGNPPWNAGIVARKATRTASAGRSALIRRKPDPDLDKPTKEIGSNRTTRKDPKKSERGQPS